VGRVGGVGFWFWVWGVLGGGGSPGAFVFSFVVELVL